ncbi:MAG: TonB family protein [Terriglobales bacterium]
MQGVPAPNPSYVDVSLEAKAIERMIDPQQAAAPRRGRFVFVLGICFAVHAAIFMLLVILDAILLPRETRTQETPVEVIVEPPPPQPKPEPQAKQEKPPEEKPKEKPPQEKPQAKQQQQQQPHEEPATDAPRAESPEKTNRPAQDKETKALRKAPPSDQTAQKPSPEKRPSPVEGAAPKVSPEPPALKQAEDKPDAEVTETAEIDHDKPDQNEPRAESLGETKKGAKSLADQLTNPEPVPYYQFSGAAKAAPVTGGTANTTYLSTLWGLIVPTMHIPERIKENHLRGDGVLVFNVDIKGNLTGIGIQQSSGFADLDAEALAAVRRAAPFPPPPRGLTYSISFAFTSR